MKREEIVIQLGGICVVSATKNIIYAIMQRYAVPVRSLAINPDVHLGPIIRNVFHRAKCGAGKVENRVGGLKRESERTVGVRLKIPRHHRINVCIKNANDHSLGSTIKAWGRDIG